MNSLIKFLLVGVIKFYQLAISPLLGANCRFTPTCSEYGLKAIKEWGPWRGGWLALKRFLRCHPWGGHGYDPVPKKVSNEPIPNAKLKG